MDIVWPLFLGNNRQHMTVCSKMVSSLVKKLSTVAKANMSVSTLQAVAASKP